MTKLPENHKKKNVAWKTTLGVLGGAVFGAGFDAIYRLTERHVVDTFTKPFILHGNTSQYSHTTSPTRKLFLLATVGIGAVAFGYHANRKAVIHNQEIDKWQQKVTNQYKVDIKDKKDIGLVK